MSMQMTSEVGCRRNSFVQLTYWASKLPADMKYLTLFNRVPCRCEDKPIHTVEELECENFPR